MSVILEALQKARVDSNPMGPAAGRVVDVPPARGVKLRPGSPAGILWLLFSLVILLVVVGGGAAGFYWVLKHKDQFTFGFNPRPIAATEPAAASATKEEPSILSDLPAPVALETVKAVAPPVPSQNALPPPPVTAAAGNIGGPSATPAAPVSMTAAAPEPKPFNLGTILCGDGNDCSAMVNGRTVHRGEMIKDHRVIEITATEVRLQRGAEAPVVLSLMQ